MPILAHDVFVDGGIAYVADGVFGLKIIDVSRPGRPEPLAELQSHAYTWTVHVAEGYAYLASGANLWIVDVSDPSQPRPVGLVPTRFAARDLVLDGTYVYLVDMLGGLYIIDVANPEQAKLLANLGLPGTSVSVALSGSHAIIADQEGALIAIDVSDPANPVQAGRLEMEFGANQVEARGATVYLANSSALQIVDFTDPGQPTLLETVPMPGFAEGIFVAEQRIYVAANYGGLVIADRVQPSGILGHSDLSGEVTGIAVRGNHAFVAKGYNGVKVLDLTNPSRPALVADLDLGSLFIRDIVVDGDHAYLVSNNGLHVFHISRPDLPQEVAIDSWFGGGFDLAVRDGLAYVCAGDGLRIIDVGNPEQPQRLAMLATGKMESIALNGDFVYFAGSDGYRVIDVSLPNQPSLVAGESSVTYSSIASRDNYAYLSTNLDVLHIFDISEPANPQLVGTAPDSGLVPDMAINSTDLYMASSFGGVNILDITDPVNPVLRESITASGYALEVLATEDYLLVGNDGQLQVFNKKQATLVNAVPWVVNNETWHSRIALFNHGTADAQVFLEAVTSAGEAREATVEISAKSLLILDGGETFPDITAYSLFIYSHVTALHVTSLITSMGTVVSDRAPSQTTATAASSLTSNLLFGYVPGDGVPALVLVAPYAQEEAQTRLCLTFYGEDSRPLDFAEIDLSGRQPWAGQVGELFSLARGQSGTITATALAGEKIAGTNFFFNDQGHPSMATPISMGGAP